MSVTLDMTQKERVFNWLKALRDSGKINMFGAPAEMQKHLGMSRAEAFAWFELWMKEFEG